MYKYFHLSQNLCVRKSCTMEEWETLFDISWSHLHQGAETLDFKYAKHYWIGPNVIWYIEQSYESFMLKSGYVCTWQTHRLKYME